MYFVYIVRCSDGTYYTGVTNDLERRLTEHNEGLDNTSYTFKRKPVKLVWNECFTEIHDALTAEKQIKGWGKKKKEALINNDYDALPDLARGKTRYMKQDKTQD